MNTILQNILVFSALFFALLFLIRKFIWKPKQTNKKGCDTEDCGCS